MKNLIKSIQEVSYHRNGVSGEGFYAVRFTVDIEPNDGAFSIYNNPTPGLPDAKFLACVFDGPGQCAVICTDLLDKYGVAFARGNSWRGDQYEPELREAIAAANTGRLGPFSIPVAEKSNV